MVVKYRLICNNIRISKLYELRCCSGHYTWYQIIIFDLRFESSVISYGSSVFHMVEKIKFEEWIKTGRPLN